MSRRRHAVCPPQPAGRGPNGRPLCRWCHEEVGKGRRTWCSSACVEEFQVRAWPARARNLVRERDQGVCARCGLDTLALRRRLLELACIDAARAEVERLGFPASAYRPWGPIGLSRFPEGRWWQADHRLPVHRGGGECGLDNLQTLCHPCHVQKGIEDRATVWTETTMTQAQSRAVLDLLTEEEAAHG